MTADLVAFLRARLDEDERTAWQLHARTCGHDATTVDAACDCDWHVGRILADVAAKRAVLTAHEPRTQTTTHLQNDPGEYIRTWYACPTCNPTQHPHIEEGCETLRLLAAVYATHPDYQEQWRP